MILCPASFLKKERFSQNDSIYNPSTAGLLYNLDFKYCIIHLVFLKCRKSSGSARSTLEVKRHLLMFVIFKFSDMWLSSLPVLIEEWP